MAENIVKYQSGTVRARLEKSERILLRNVDFSLDAGESLALIGETGSGKTILALSLMKLLPPNVTAEAGELIFLGQDLSESKNMQAHLGKTIVYIPQNGLEFLNPTRTVRHHLYDGLQRMGVKRGLWAQMAEEKLRLSGFSEAEAVLDKYPFQLSGGMAQRVTIALAACSEAKLIIADEPTNGLDSGGKEAFWELLDSLFPTAARIIITHDMSVAAQCSRALVLCGGRALEKGSAEGILERPYHPYTRALMGALVKNGMEESPVLRKEKGECPFYKRCKAAKNECRNTLRYHASEDREWWCNDI